MNSQAVFFAVLVIAAIVMATLLGEVRVNPGEKRNAGADLELNLPVR